VITDMSREDKVNFILDRGIQPSDWYQRVKNWAICDGYLDELIMDFLADWPDGRGPHVRRIIIDKNGRKRIVDASRIGGDE
tara:strand:+ start:543 stop:785 length:243 start_codon:yes stop_codon:yes gene_type:complete